MHKKIQNHYKIKQKHAQNERKKCKKLPKTPAKTNNLYNCKNKIRMDGVYCPIYISDIHLYRLVYDRDVPLSSQTYFYMHQNQLPDYFVR